MRALIVLQSGNSTIDNMLQTVMSSAAQLSEVSNSSFEETLRNVSGNTPVANQIAFVLNNPDMFTIQRVNGEFVIVHSEISTGYKIARTTVLFDHELEEALVKVTQCNEFISKEGDTSEVFALDAAVMLVQ